jgi:hypothetical protein
MNILYYKTIKLLCFMSLSLLSNLTFSQIQGEYESNKVNCIGSFQFKKASYYDYQINAQKSDSIYQKVSEGNKPEDLLTQKYSDFFLKSTPDERKEIILYSRIILEYNLSEYYYIKYALKDRKMTHKVAIFKKEGNIWKWLDNSDNKISEAITIILKLQNEAFSQFEVDDDNPKYLEINQLKASVKDADNTLNIFKLADVIEKNSSRLSKYFSK